MTRFNSEDVDAMILDGNEPGLFECVMAHSPARVSLFELFIFNCHPRHGKKRPARERICLVHLTRDAPEQEYSNFLSSLFFLSLLSMKVDRERLTATLLRNPLEVPNYSRYYISEMAKHSLSKRNAVQWASALLEKGEPSRASSALYGSIPHSAVLSRSLPC